MWRGLAHEIKANMSASQKKLETRGNQNNHRPKKTTRRIVGLKDCCQRTHNSNEATYNRTRGVFLRANYERDRMHRLTGPDFLTAMTVKSGQKSRSCSSDHKNEAHARTHRI